MCLIIVCPPGKTPDMDTIIDATYDNPDGSGWCMRVNGGMEWVRSATNVDHVIGSFYAAREQHPDTWAVWHSRFATHGTTDDNNTHPFPVPGKPWMLMHNGMLPLSDGFRGGRSDSRILAEDHISEMTWEEMLHDKVEFEKWLQGDKVVILSERREKHGPCLILNENRGIWAKDDGCWYSHAITSPIQCTTCGKRLARCQCVSWKTYKPTPTAWEEEALDEYVEWWAKNDPEGHGDGHYAVGSTIHTGDLDCDCLDCEEVRYWEEMEAREGSEAMLMQFAKANALSAEDRG